MKSKFFKQCFAILILIVSHNYYAASQDTSSLVKANEKLLNLKRLFDKPDSFTGNDFGRKVDFNDADSCIRLFKPDMHRHGIQNTTKSRIIWRRTRIITECESFTGKNLLEWMTNITDEFPEGTNIDDVEIRIFFGVYTKSFLEKYCTDPSIKAQKNNRITAFVIPFLVTTDKRTGNKKETPGSSAYDLGNLHP